MNTPVLITEDDPKFAEAKERNKGITYVDADTQKVYTIDEPEGGFFYAYKKKRSENIQIAMTPDGKRLYTSPCFAHQAKQAVKWIDRLEDKLKIVVHGESLTKSLLECHWNAKQKALKNIGTRRWTEKYMELQKKLHSEHHYGTKGKHDTELVGRAILALSHSFDRKISILDYGCGNGSLAKQLNFTFKCVDITKYDPFQDEFSKDPEGKFDVVTCFDVMEHVEEECVENTLKYIAERAKYMTVFSIALSDAKKVLDDGRNAHITQHHPEWWVNRLNKYFIVTEVAASPGEQIFVVCQALDAAENARMEKEEILVEAV
jgi:SAM-dependent methyltransferase